MKAEPAPATELGLLPWRGPGNGRPRLALPDTVAPEGHDPAARMPLRLGGALRKRWRYVGAYCEELMLCAAAAEVGPLALEFWGIWDREREQMHQSTRRILPGRSRHLTLDGGPVAAAAQLAPPATGGVDERPATVRLRSRPADLDLDLGAWAPVESICPTPAGAYVWTRKVAGAPARGRARLAGGRTIEFEGVGVIDDSAGYHPRRTEWLWSAGAGVAADGRPIAWNLVEGVNDPPRGSERAIWIDGIPHEPEPVGFDGLRGIAFRDGSAMRFAAEGERSRRESIGPLLRSSYRAPFGTFAGELEGVKVGSAMGVMEQHDAVW